MTAAFITAAYRLDLPPREHLLELARAGARTFGPGGQVAAIAIRHVPSASPEIDVQVGRGDERIMRTLKRGARLLTAAERHRAQSLPPTYESCSNLLGPSRTVTSFREDGFADVAGLMCPTGPSSGVAVCATYSEAKAVRPHERRYYRAAAVHVASAWRLRQALESGRAHADAVLRPDGSAVHLEGALKESSARDLLRSVVVAREHARCRESGDDAASGFPGLLAGTWTLADRFESDGKRYVIAYRVAHEPASEMLSDAARRALELATRGVANKVIALELGVSQATVTRLLARALEALRLSDLREAIALARTAPARFLEHEPALCAWTFACEPPAPWSGLSKVEREIVQELTRGASRAQIAEARGTSLHTVNSQIASAYAKLGVRSRRELMRHSVTG